MIKEKADGMRVLSRTRVSKETKRYFLTQVA
jgi:hypothetical protein